MELDPLYADLIVDRYQRFTGRPAVLERAGTRGAAPQSTAVEEHAAQPDHLSSRVLLPAGQRNCQATGGYRAWPSTNSIKESSKGTGFQQPLRPHEHWHVDISYVNVCGTFYYLTSVLDGASRYIAHWELRESMREADVEIVLQRAREKFPDATPRIITDNGPQSGHAVLRVGPRLP